MFSKLVVKGLLCSLFISSTAFAAQEKDDVETIEVVGKKPLQYFFKMKEEKRFEFMQAFNQLVEDKDMHFECRRERETGSHLKKEVCRNAFDWRIRQEAVSNELISGNMSTAQSAASMGNVEQREKQKELLATINTLLETHPEFSNTFDDFQAANRAYKDAHAREFGSLSKHAEETN